VPIIGVNRNMSCACGHPDCRVIWLHLDADYNDKPLIMCECPTRNEYLWFTHSSHPSNDKE